MKKLKILLLNASHIYGGGEFFVYQLANLLKNRGHEVWVSCRDDNDLYWKCSEAHINLFPQAYPDNSGIKKVIKISKALKSFIAENRIEIVHSNTNYDRTVGAYAAKLAHVPHVTTNHSHQSISYNITHRLRNRYLIDHFIVDGECTRDLHVNEDHINKKRISTSHLGLNPEPVKRSNELRKMIREEFKIADDEILIGNVARMVPFKGQEYLIRAYSQVKPEYPKTKLMIVGDGELSMKLKELVKEQNIENATIFPGFRNDLQAIYSAFDLYSHTSIEGGGEMFPYTILHALGQGLPVVATKVGDVPAMVKDGENGFIVPDKDIDEISGKLKILCADGLLRNKMGRKSYELLIDEFTTEKMIEKIENIYYKVLEERKRR